MSDRTDGLQQVIVNLTDQLFNSQRATERLCECIENLQVVTAPSATVERFRIYGFMKSQYCVSPTGGDDQYQNHFARFVIGEVVATFGNNGYSVTIQINGGFVELTIDQYKCIRDMMLKSGVWEKKQ